MKHKFIGHWILQLGVLLIAFHVGACNDTSFMGSNSKKKPGGGAGSGAGKNGNGTDPNVDITTINEADLPKPDINLGEGDEDPPLVFGPEFKGSFLSQGLESSQKSHLWVATTLGNAYYFELDGKTIIRKKKWNNLTNGSGTRTYVTEGGVIMAQTGGHLFWIDRENTPEGALNRTSPTYFKLSGPGTSDRVCVVSYRKNEARYLGMAYGMGNFVEFAMENTAPFAPKWDQQTGTVNVGAAVQWGYSCYIDQENLIYYSEWVTKSPAAVSLANLTAVAANTVAPNGSFSSTNLTAETQGTSKEPASYAMGGDRSGNVFNGSGYYTLAYEPKNKTVWGGGYSGGNLSIMPRDCLTKTATCSGHAAFPMATSIGAQVGPLSALGNGYMVGLVRQVGDIYIMNQKVDGDITAGIEATKIDTVEGDPYMYTDFTGATLYMTNALSDFDLTKGKQFDPTKPIKATGFTWAAHSGKSDVWSEIKLEIRCYKAGEAKADFEVVDPVKNAFEQTIANLKSCTGKVADHVEVKLTQLNNKSTLMNVKKVQITAYQ